MAADSSRNSSELNATRTLSGSTSTSPREADSTYEVVAMLSPISNGPKVMTPQ